jgi:hypothetical protein
MARDCVLKNPDEMRGKIALLDFQQEDAPCEDYMDFSASLMRLAAAGAVGMIGGYDRWNNSRDLASFYVPAGIPGLFLRMWNYDPLYNETKKAMEDGVDIIVRLLPADKESTFRKSEFSVARIVFCC